MNGAHRRRATSPLGGTILLGAHVSCLQWHPGSERLYFHIEEVVERHQTSHTPGSWGAGTAAVHGPWANRRMLLQGFTDGTIGEKLTQVMLMTFVQIQMDRAPAPGAGLWKSKAADYCRSRMMRRATEQSGACAGACPGAGWSAGYIALLQACLLLLAVISHKPRIWP